MLVLSRRLDESIVLPNYDASITILGISGGRVRLGISAPSHVEIYRREVWERIQREASLVASVAPSPHLPTLPR